VPAGPYTHHLRVRYGEVDMQRVVFNAHYLAYCDDAMESWVRRVGVRVAADGWDFMLKKATIEWDGAAGVHDELAIDVEVSRWGTTSFDVGFRGRVGERPVFTATVTYVGVVTGTRDKAAPPPVVRELLGGPA
jgi:acyl-CoA thioester hydrolase